MTGHVLKGAVVPYKEYTEMAKKPLLTPAMWKYRELVDAVRASDRDWKRRILALSHPDLVQDVSVAQDLAIIVQLMKPGERSQLHRHSPWAIHFALQGKGYTNIDGVRYDWEFGDVVLTPAWTYHEHVNESETEDAILYSMQNLPLLARANSLFREEPAGEPPRHVLRKRDGEFKPDAPSQSGVTSSWR
ncbi:gentisate 1,2-dioxygenase [Bradyrhizobium sp. USDA 3256]